MVKVRLKNPWFAPGADHFKGGKDVKGTEGKSMTACSGEYFERGVHDIPEELVRHLPSSAKVLDEDYVAPEPEEIDPREDLTSRDVYDVQAEHDAEEEPEPAPKRGRGRRAATPKRGR